MRRMVDRGMEEKPSAGKDSLPLLLLERRPSSFSSLPPLLLRLFLEKENVRFISLSFPGEASRGLLSLPLFLLAGLREREREKEKLLPVMRPPSPLGLC